MKLTESLLKLRHSRKIPLLGLKASTEVVHAITTTAESTGTTVGSTATVRATTTSAISTTVATVAAISQLSKLWFICMECRVKVMSRQQEKPTRYRQGRHHILLRRSCCHRCIRWILHRTHRQEHHRDTGRKT